MPMHADQLHVDAELVAGLVRSQFPQWSELPIRGVATTGTVNGVFRIGDALVARLPLQGEDPAAVLISLEREMAATREFATVSTVSSPEPVALGGPGLGYPLPWAVQTWVPGDDAVAQPPKASLSFAEDLASLLAGLRAVDVQGRRFRGAGRGGHLPDHDDWMALCFTSSEGLVDVDRLRAMWDELRELPEVDADVMCHGDLTPPNVLVGDGRLVGVLDTGGFGPADPALDLVPAWHLLDAEQRAVLRSRLGCSDVQWARGQAWALQQAMGLVWYYAESNPIMAAWGHQTLERLLE